MHVDNSEKIKAMEEAVLAEKEQIRKQFEKQKAKIMQQTELEADEKQKLMGELAKKEEAQ